MKRIEISTAHNIVIMNESASVIQRVLAFGLDAIILMVFYAIIAMVSSGNTIVMYFIMISIGGFYHLLFEVFNNGQSPGKRVLNIRVVSLKGTAPKIRDVFIRWVFRTVDITLSLGMLAVLAINGSQKNQRIGDRLGQCLVINLGSNNYMSLHRIASLDTDKEVKYTGVSKFDDKDMLLVKHVLQRYKTHNNRETLAVLQDLSDQIASGLNIDLEGLSKPKFLRQILQDYIILTR